MSEQELKLWLKGIAREITRWCHGVARFLRVIRSHNDIEHKYLWRTAAGENKAYLQKPCDVELKDRDTLFFRLIPKKDILSK